MGDRELWDEVALIRGGGRSLEMTGSRYWDEDAVPADGVIVPSPENQSSAIMFAQSITEWDLCSKKGP